MNVELREADEQQAAIREQLDVLRLEKESGAEVTGRMQEQLRQAELTLQRHTFDLERLQGDLDRLSGDQVRQQARLEQVETELDRLERGELVSSEQLEASYEAAVHALATLRETIASHTERLRATEETDRILRQRLEQAQHAERQAEAATRKLETELHELQLKRQWKVDALEEKELVFELLPPLDVPLEEAKEEFKLLVRQLDEIGPSTSTPSRSSTLSMNVSRSCRCSAMTSSTPNKISMILSRDGRRSDTSLQGDVCIRSCPLQTDVHRMFGGGEADLKLVDETDLLNTESISWPNRLGRNCRRSAYFWRRACVDGDRLAVRHLEDAPGPFCVLDEVEAALDEANVHRFGEYIRTLSLDTQFVIITHRKGTMEAADTLYGVTMQQNGVSEVLSSNCRKRTRRGIRREMEESR